MRYRLFLLLLLIGFGIGAYFWWQTEAPPRVVVVQPTRGPAVDAIYATGTVEPIRWAKVASTETGRIDKYPASEGQTVRAGEVLVCLDDTEARANLNELQARVAFLKTDLKRYEALAKRSTVSQQAYDRAKSVLQQAQAAAMAAQQRLTELTIVAPLDGVVLRKDGEVGDVVRAGEVLLWVGQDRPYWVTAEVDEEDVPRVEPGQRALMTSDAFPGQVLEGKVARITPMGDPINKNYRVRILLPEDSPLMVGMTTEVNIIARAEEEALLIPESAIVDGAVWVVEDGLAHRRTIRIGVYGDDRVEILEGLTQRNAVIAEPPPDLADGQAVTVTNEQP